MSTATKKDTAKKTASATPGKSSPDAKGPAKGGDNKMAQKQTPFEKLFHDLLKDIYWCEQQLVTALPQMKAAAATEDLQDAFEEHLYVTQKHVNRLEQVFSLLGIKPEAKKCDAMEGLIKEGQHTMQETPAGSMTRDAALIISAQKIEHYEIAAYGSLVQVALTLGHKRAARILEKTLSDEEDTDILLSDIAETEVNPMADEEGENVPAESSTEEGMSALTGKM